MATATEKAFRFRLKWNAKGLTLEEREGPGSYTARAGSGLEIPPTPFAVTHPELKAVIRETIRRFGKQELNGDGGMDVVLSPPWGTAWLFDVDGLPEDEIEDQVAWELQQRLDAPLEEHIYAWHPQDEQVYAVVIRPEMLEFWDRLFQDAHLELGSITLETGLVDPRIEAGADLLPLYHLWANRHGKRPAVAKPARPTISDEEAEQYLGGGDEELEREFEEFGIREERVHAVDPQFEDEEEAEEALEAILESEEAQNRKRRKQRRRRAVFLLFLLFLIAAAAGVWQRDRIAQRIPNGEKYVNLGERAVRKGVREVRALVDKVRSSQLKKPATPVAVKSEETPSQGEAVSPPPAETSAPVPESETPQPEPSQPELATQEEQPTTTPQRDTSPEETTAPSAAPTGASTSGIPVVTVPLQTVERPPVKPSTGLALTRLYRLADSDGVEIESLIMQGPGLRFEVAGEESEVDRWARDISEIPGGGAARVEAPALLAPGILAEMDLQGIEERSLTQDQFTQLATSVGLQELDPSVWSADRAGLDRLFKAFEQEKTRPFRLSIHLIQDDTYHLVVLP